VCRGRSLGRLPPRRTILVAASKTFSAPQSSPPGSRAVNNRRGVQPADLATVRRAQRNFRHVNGDQIREHLGGLPFARFMRQRGLVIGLDVNLGVEPLDQWRHDAAMQRARPYPVSCT
jgi:hypothetical protein